jgi:hypothetical protein
VFRRTLHAISCVAIIACGSDPRVELGGEARALLDPSREATVAPEATIARLHIPPDAVIADVGAGPGFLFPFPALDLP